MHTIYINEHVRKCVTCRVDEVETDIPHSPFQKISLDISGSYGPTDRGNCYILSFVDWLTG